jgi:hypothetical protein
MAVRERESVSVYIPCLACAFLHSACLLAQVRPKSLEQPVYFSSHGGLPMRKLSMRRGVAGGSSYNPTLDPARVELP